MVWPDRSSPGGRRSRGTATLRRAGVRTLFRAAAIALVALLATVGVPQPSAAHEPPTSGVVRPRQENPPPFPSAALTARLAELRRAYRIPGIEATIIFADGRSWRAHAGFRDYERRITLANRTPLAIASVSKTFIAALVIQLAGEGWFGLDDPVVRWLPSARVDPGVTIRELLDHTSGVFDFFSNTLIDRALLDCPACAWTPSKALSYVKKPYFVPGAGWHYSNTGYVLLGELVDQVTGTAYPALLRQRFFEPLGLISTYVQGVEPAPFPVSHSYRFTTPSLGEAPKPLWDGTGVAPFRSVTTAAGSAGAIASSARDLALWARFLYSGAILGPSGLAEMLDVAPSLPYRADAPYGLGVQQYLIGGRLAYGHGGRLLGARSAIRYLPAEGISIAVVQNTDRGDPGVIAEELLAVILAPLPTPAPSPGPSPAP